MTVSPVSATGSVWWWNSATPSSVNANRIKSTGMPKTSIVGVNPLALKSSSLHMVTTIEGRTLARIVESAIMPTMRHDAILSVQRLQPAGDVARREIGLRQQLAHGEEAVELAGKVLVADGHAGVLQPFGVFVAFVAQRIGAGRQQIGRRQSGQRFGAGGRGAPVVDVGIAEIVVLEPLDHRMRQQNAGLGLAMRGMRHRKIGSRIDQDLAGEFG